MNAVAPAASSAERGSARVMGVLNVTPDSFSDGGRHARMPEALARARELIAEGAAIVDVGGESTRPGARPVPVAEELGRVVPVIRAIRADSRISISVDTSQPEVMRAAVRAGADMINDVRALARPGALAAAAELDVPVCLMHMRGEPATMQRAPRYRDVVGEVRAFLARRCEECVAAGVRERNLMVDPGFGFGKSIEHNLALLANLATIASIGAPVVVGLSRKSMIGKITGRPNGERASASALLAAIAVGRGAEVVRAHDVAVTVDALALWARVTTACEEYADG